MIIPYQTIQCIVSDHHSTSSLGNDYRVSKMACTAAGVLVVPGHHRQTIHSSIIDVIISETRKLVTQNCPAPRSKDKTVKFGLFEHKFASPGVGRIGQKYLFNASIVLPLVLYSS
jgi:hypothetical protein